MTALRQRMLEDLRIRNYAPTTVACYIRSVAEFAQHFHKPPDQLGPEEIRSWQLFLLNERRVKLSTYIQAVCALRFFYRNTLNRKIEIDRIPLPRYEKKLCSKRRGTSGTARFWPRCMARDSGCRK
jgi:integrase/recombinase XerD